MTSSRGTREVRNLSPQLSPDKNPKRSCSSVTMAFQGSGSWTGTIKEMSRRVQLTLPTRRGTERSAA